jgi:hypothetical protein
LSERNNTIKGGQTQKPKDLKDLLAQLNFSLCEDPVNLDNIKDSLVCLFSFLCEPKNRTHNNCKAVDLFFCIDNHSDVSWNSLPDDYRQLFDDIGGCLHDTVKAPEIATNFESTPEQLLLRAKKLNEEN